MKKHVGYRFIYVVGEETNGPRFTIEGREYTIDGSRREYLIADQVYEVAPSNGHVPIIRE